MKRLNETELRNLIKQELSSYKASKNEGMMTEARANLLAENMINEIGLFAAIGAGLKGMMSGTSAAGQALGGAAVKALAPVGKAVSAMKTQATAAVQSVGNFVASIQNDAVKAAVEARNKAIMTSIEASVKKVAADGMQDLVGLKDAAGKPVFDEATAKSLIASMIASAVSNVVSGGTNQ